MNINDFLINEECTMVEAMQLLDKVAKKVLFVADKDILLAAITDGDIRRWILKKGNLDAKVKEIANYSPIFIFEKDKPYAKDIMKEKVIESLPVVDENKKIISIVFMNDTAIYEKSILKLPVVIMAGGLGTRLFPYTKILPKPLIPIGEIPIVEHIMKRFRTSGCEKFYLIVNHKKNMIKAYINEIEKDYAVEFIDEDIPLGTGGGLSLMKGLIDTTFILSNCDILIQENYEKIYKCHKKEKNLITMVCSLKTIKIPYGVIDIDKSGNLESMKEKPELSFFANTGMYIVEPQVIDEIEDNKSMGFTDIIDQYLKDNKKVGIYPISEYAWMDMGQIEEMDAMRKRIESDE